MATTKTPLAQMQISVQDRAEDTISREIPLIFSVAGIADNTPAWPSLSRDIYLDDFWRSEPMLAGALYSMVSKLAALDFKITGPRKGVERSVNMLRRAEFGSGWLTFIQKTALDIMTQDNGGFVELCRPTSAAPTAIVEDIAQIDSQRCERTGDPQYPVHYTDNEGKVHRLAWYEVVPLTDFPSSRETHKGIGFCAVSRILRMAQVLRDVATYKRQKLAGKRVPGILLVQGIRQGAVEAALTRSEADEIINLGRTLYTGPVVVAGPDPGMPVDAKLIELAGLPDGYDEDTLFKWYIATVAMGFGTDYAEFAPLPGGNLGTASQVETMAARARGKGPGVLLQQFEHLMNFNVLPASQWFEFASTDAAAETARINLRYNRARERALRVNTGEITARQALQLAIAEGDAPEGFLVEMDTAAATTAGGGELVEGPGDEEMVAPDERTEIVVRSLRGLTEAYDLVEMDMRRRKLDQYG